MIDHNLLAVTEAARQLGHAVESLIDGRNEKCSRACPGFSIDGDTYEIEICSACAHRNGYAEGVSNEHVAMSKRAQEARLKQMIADGVAEEA